MTEMDDMLESGKQLRDATIGFWVLVACGILFLIIVCYVIWRIYFSGAWVGG